MSEATSSHDPVTENIGQRIKILRQQRQWSVTDLASQAKVSSGIVSQIERGKANPSIRTLDRIRLALDVPLTTILEGDSETERSKVDFVRRKIDRLSLTVGPHALVKEYLSPHNAKDLNFMFITFPPHSESADVVRGPGEKGGIVMQGQVVLSVNGVDSTLYEGDSFQFSSESQHQVSNTQDKESTILWIMSAAPKVPDL